MALTLTAAPVAGLINTIGLAWEGQTGRYVTVYRSTTDITPSPVDGVIDWSSVDWSAQTVIGEQITGSSLKDAGLTAETTYYYYVTDGTEVASASATPTSPGTVAPEIQPDYEAVGISTVTQTDAYMRALNNGGSVKLNTLKVPAGALAIVAIAANNVSDLTEVKIGSMVAELGNATGFAVLQTGTVESFSGYEAQLTGSTQVKYVASKSN